jgi:two-component system chemotaxis response regulator CheB
MKILVVDGSAPHCALLVDALDEDPELRVDQLAHAADAPAAVEAQLPDLVVLDLESAGAAALDAVTAIMQRRPTPILVLTSDEATVGLEESRRRGALDGFLRPAAGDAAAFTALRQRVRWLARVPVVRHSRVPPLRPEAPRRLRRPIVGIAASAGGSAAIGAVLAELRADFGGCIAVVQHLPVGFAGSFAALLGERCRLPVQVVARRELARPGTVLVADDDRHLEARADGTLAPSDAPPLGGHRPSATVLFRSLAQVCGPDAVGVILSGMGDDGAAGLVEMRQRGALTIAQYRQTAAVFGMPGAANDAGGAERILPLDQIAGALALAVGARR